MKKRCLGCMQEYDASQVICPYCGYVEGTLAEEAYHISPGTRLQDKYVVGKVLGFGGFGVTYIGWDEELERKIAIKEYMPSEFATRMPDQTQVTVFGGDKEEQFTTGMKKFVDEAKKLARFNQVNGIVSIYDCFIENNTSYIVMEYLEGETLKSYLEREGKMSPEDAVNTILPVLYALRGVHKDGIIHRDIAPDNIFLTNDYDDKGHRIVKLLDFGAARFATTNKSRSLSVLIKPGYTPEEQYRSRGDQGPWTDVYAVCATMYKMITGITPEDAMERSAKDEVKPISKCGVEISKGMENAILNGMNIKIENRTQSAEELIEELENADTLRKKEKLKKTDVGQWPLWLKAIAGVSAAAAVGIGIFAANMVWGNTDNYELGKNEKLIPFMVGMEKVQAQEIVTDNKMIFQILDKQYSADVDPDKVLAQTAYGVVNTDDVNTLGVVLSAGTEKTFVPDVVGYAKDVANEMLLDLNMDPSYTEKKGNEAPGAVVSQNIKAGEQVDGGTVIEITISKGRDYDTGMATTVPKIVGLTYQKASKKLAKSSLYILKTEAVADDKPAGTVIKQDLVPNADANGGDVVSVTVSLGRGKIAMPDVEFKTLKKAQKLLESSGLKVKTVEEENDTVAKGNVIRASVEAGADVEIGTTVTLYISKGNDKVSQELTAEDAVVTQETKEDFENEWTKVADETPVAAVTDSTPKQETKKKKKKADTSSSSSSSSSSASDKTTVPDVTGKTESAAQTALINKNLDYSVKYAFDSSVSEGKVSKQSKSSGTSVSEWTTITITVSKGPKCTTTDWTEDSSWKNSRWYDTDEKTQYRYRNTRTETDTKSNIEVDSAEYNKLIDDGYTEQYRHEEEVWGGWSEYSTTEVTSDDTRQVRTYSEYDDDGNEIIYYSYCDVTDYVTYATLTKNVVKTDTGWGNWQDTQKEKGTYTEVEKRTVYRYVERSTKK